MKSLWNWLLFLILSNATSSVEFFFTLKVGVSDGVVVVNRSLQLTFSVTVHLIKKSCTVVLPPSPVRLNYAMKIPLEGLTDCESYLSHLFKLLLSSCLFLQREQNVMNQSPSSYIKNLVHGFSHSLGGYLAASTGWPLCPPSPQVDTIQCNPVHINELLNVSECLCIECLDVCFL